MAKTSGSIKKNQIIVFARNLDNEKDIFLTDNILLREITDKEKANFLKYSDDDYNVTHCFEFLITDEFIEYIKVEEENKLSAEDLEFFVLTEAVWQILKMEEAINISKSHPCEILRADIINDKKYIADFTNDKYNLYLDIKTKYFEDMNCLIEEKDIKTINAVFSLLVDKSRDKNRDYKKYWWLIPTEYYNRHCNSYYTADQIIDLIIALESLLSGSGENTEINYRLKLRSSLYLYHINHYHPEQVQKVLNEAYSLRSKIVHGTISLAEPEFKELKYAQGTKISIQVATRMLKEILRIMLLDAILNHQKKSKDEFIKFIDSIWYQDINKSKINFIDDYDIVWKLKDP